MNKETDWRRFNTAMARLCVLFDKKPDKELLAVYWDNLKDMSIDQVEAACRKAEGSCQFMPKPVDMKVGTTKDITEKANTAYAEAIRAIRRYGSYRSVRFDDPATQLAIREMGGWGAFGGMTDNDWTRKRFVDAYTGASKDIERLGIRGAAVPNLLEGLHGGGDVARIGGDCTWVAQIGGAQEEPKALKDIKGSVKKLIEDLTKEPDGRP